MFAAIIAALPAIANAVGAVAGLVSQAKDEKKAADAQQTAQMEAAVRGPQSSSEATEFDNARSA